MRKNLVLDLAECTEFRQTLAARPPRIVHGTAILLVALLCTALTWSALTQADLVVRAAGRVRPVSTPTKVFSAGRSEVFSASTGGRVVEVNFREGQQVRAGDVLVRLDTERLDNEIAKRKRALQATEEELARMILTEELIAKQFEAAKGKGEAELAQALEEVRQAKDRRATDIRLAELEVESAQDAEGRVRKLMEQGAAGSAELTRAIARLREAKEKLQKARLPVDEGKVTVLRKALELADKDFAVKREELALKRTTKQSEVETARLELANLELERKQSALRAPIAGVVTFGNVKVGDILEPGKAVVEIAEQAGFRFEALVSSEEVSHLRIGMPARIKLDAYDYQRYGTLNGTVSFISPDSVVLEGQPAAFYLVRIEVEGTEVSRGELLGPVKLGMAGQVEIVTDQQSVLSLLVRKIRRTISLG